MNREGALTCVPTQASLHSGDAFSVYSVRVLHCSRRCSGVRLGRRAVSCSCALAGRRSFRTAREFRGCSAHCVQRINGHAAIVQRGKTTTLAARSPTSAGKRRDRKRRIRENHCSRRKGAQRRVGFGVIRKSKPTSRTTYGRTLRQRSTAQMPYWAQRPASETTCSLPCRRPLGASRPGGFRIRANGASDGFGPNPQYICNQPTSTHSPHAELKLPPGYYVFWADGAATPKLFESLIGGDGLAQTTVVIPDP
jgi:hypothetical protein